MNFLAHLHVADPAPESLIGNLIADFVLQFGRSLPDAENGDGRSGAGDRRRYYPQLVRHAATATG